MSGRNILIVHQNFPGQFPHLTDALLARGDRVAAVGGPTAKERSGVDLRRWSNNRSSTPGLLPDATRAEADMIRGRAAAEAAIMLKRSGFEPDLIVGHPGWGETLHLRDIFPRARLILFGEYYYRAVGGDVDFDREYETPTPDRTMRSTAKNATLALACTMADRIVCPTPFQASTFPDIFQPRIRVIHEGIDLDRARCRPDAQLEIEGGRVLEAGMPVITFISRTLERLRGFHIFMRALPAVQAAIPDTRVVIIGGEKGAGYGGAPLNGGSWKSSMLAELGDRINPGRLHFLGQVPHQRMIDALSISAAHVYYTYPFVLSWSLLEAMACECLILGSDTAPVRDAVTNGVDGILNPFFDVTALSHALIRALREPATFAPLRRAARETAMRFDTAAVGIPAWLRLIDAMA